MRRLLTATCACALLTPLVSFADTAPISCGVSATPNSITAGASSKLVWWSINATGAEFQNLNANPTQVTLSGSQYITPTQSRTITLFVRDDAGHSAHCAASITIVSGSGKPTPVPSPQPITYIPTQSILYVQPQYVQPVYLYPNQLQWRPIYIPQIGNRNQNQNLYGNNNQYGANTPGGTGSCAQDANCMYDSYDRTYDPGDYAPSRYVDSPDLQGSMTGNQYSEVFSSCDPVTGQCLDQYHNCGVDEQCDALPYRSDPYPAPQVPENPIVVPPPSQLRDANYFEDSQNDPNQAQTVQYYDVSSPLPTQSGATWSDIQGDRNPTPTWNIEMDNQNVQLYQSTPYNVPADIRQTVPPVDDSYEGPMVPRYNTQDPNVQEDI